jgi:hypothetical protein
VIPPNPQNVVLRSEKEQQEQLKEYDVFLSFARLDERVSLLHSKLQYEGLKPWTDVSSNKNNMAISLAEGIRKSRFFLVFLTAHLNEKFKRGETEKEWCFRELNYASYFLPPSNIILVVLEKEMTMRKHWSSILQFLFANEVFYDLSDDLLSSSAWSSLICRLRESEVI